MEVDNPAGEVPKGEQQQQQQESASALPEGKNLCQFQLYNRIEEKWVTHKNPRKLEEIFESNRLMAEKASEKIGEGIQGMEEIQRAFKQWDPNNCAMSTQLLNKIVDLIKPSDED